jgi:hypothetical protein
MTTGKSADRRARASWAWLYLRGLNVAASGNAQAFGYSILITVSYGIVSASSGKPSPVELIGFALSAVAAFSLLNILVAYVSEKRSGNAARTRVVLVATATDFLAVGAGLGAVFGVTAILGGWAAWILAPCVAGLVYVLVQALELAVGEGDSDEG